MQKEKRVGATAVGVNDDDSDKKGKSNKRA